MNEEVSHSSWASLTVEQASRQAQSVQPPLELFFTPEAFQSSTYSTVPYLLHSAVGAPQQPYRNLYFAVGGPELFIFYILLHNRLLST